MGPVGIIIRCEGIDWYVSHLTQLCSQLSVTLANVVHLDLTPHKLAGLQLEVMDDVEWRHLLHPFSTVRTLYVSGELTGHVALALEDITEGIVLPSLDLIRLVGHDTSSVKKVVASRRLSNHPITAIDTLTEFIRRIASYV